MPSSSDFRVASSKKRLKITHELLGAMVTGKLPWPYVYGWLIFTGVYLGSRFGFGGVLSELSLALDLSSRDLDHLTPYYEAW